MDDLYLDANATTPVLPQARDAALAVMAETFGNPSSTHASGLRARAVLERTRAAARRVLGAAEEGQLLFTSGATEAIQTAVLSALTHWRDQRAAGRAVPPRLLYGATEHKAVPEALRHWNALLGLDLRVEAIPVGCDGRHDLAWLRAHAGDAALVCTMAANNETGVLSDLDGLAQALVGQPALWLVDSVQALGKLARPLAQRRIDYAPFSGHKFYAPKGIGLLYVAPGRPLTPLMAGGGQEQSARSGTENMVGIAALGAVLEALETGQVFAGAAQLHDHRERLAAALREAFPGVVFNAAFETSLPTTLNFAVPDLGSRLLLELFDAAGLRLSAGSACSAARALPSAVLAAMGLAPWRSTGAVRLSFGALDSTAFIEEACARIRRCGAAWRQTRAAAHCAGPVAAPWVQRWLGDGACGYLVADGDSPRCVVVDPPASQVTELAQRIRALGWQPLAVLNTSQRGAPTAAAAALRQALGLQRSTNAGLDPLGWPRADAALHLGRLSLTRLPLARHPLPGGHARGDGAPADVAAAVYLLHRDGQAQLALVGDLLRPAADDDAGTAGREHAGADPAMTLERLAQVIGPHTLLLPAQDAVDHLATTVDLERQALRHVNPVAGSVRPAPMGVAAHLPPAELGVDGETLANWRTQPDAAWVVDVREAHETALPGPFAQADEAVPLSLVASALPRWLALPASRPLVFVCRSGARGTQVARALRRLGHPQAFSLSGGVALWRAPGVEVQAGA